MEKPEREYCAILCEAKNRKTVRILGIGIGYEAAVKDAVSKGHDINDDVHTYPAVLSERAYEYLKDKKRISYDSSCIRCPADGRDIWIADPTIYDRIVMMDETESCRRSRGYTVSYFDGPYFDERGAFYDKREVKKGVHFEPSREA